MALSGFTSAQERLGRSAGSAAQGDGTQTSALVRKALQAKLNKGPNVQQTSAAGAENLSETAATNQVVQRAEQAGMQQATQAQGAAIQDSARADAATQAAAQETIRRQTMKDRFSQEVASQLQALAQSKKSLDLDKNRAEAESIGFRIRLSNDQYIDRLQREGETRRLDDMANFKKEAMEQAIGFTKELYGNEIGNAMVSAQSKADFMETLAQLDLDQWLQGMEYAAKSAGASSMASGFGQIGQAGAKAYDNGSFSKKGDAGGGGTTVASSTDGGMAGSGGTDGVLS